MTLKLGKTLTALLLVASTHAFATAFNTPPDTESLIGRIQYVNSGSGDTATTIAEHYDLGYNALESANPQMDLSKSLSYGQDVQLPTQHLLPDLPRRGIVINLPEMRMYYYPEGSNQVLTYPIGIGKIGKTIPITMTSITRKTKDPVWIPPDDIREFNLGQGVILPRVMPPGPDNPLGPYAIYMEVPTYLIHSTIFPESIGKRASFGCIRMYEADIKTFFPSIEGGIPVAIVNSPVKTGWQDDKLYMEVYKPLEEHGSEYEASMAGMVHSVMAASSKKPALIDWQALAFIAKERDGVPHEVGVQIPQ